jgi:tripartite-type tricarboxylate transporter receptor subunit TctC
VNSWTLQVTAAAAICISLVTGTAAAAAFPEKPIRIIVPTAIGGPSDLCVRAVTEAMQAHLGQPLIVENVTGATGNIGLERVANAAPDGYTLAQASAANTDCWRRRERPMRSSRG